MRPILALTAAVLLAAPAQAEEMLVIGADVCSALTVKYKPADDVEYKPGVDVNGQPVAPADLSPPISAPTSVTIPITIDLAARLGLRFGAEAQIGTVRYQDGAVYFDGQRLDTDNEAALAAICWQHLKGKR